MSRKLESKKVTIHRINKEIFDFLIDFNNFSHLLPQEVANWQTSGDACSFEIKGLATIGLRITEKIPYNSITMKGEGKIPFAFSFDFRISELSNAQSEVQIVALAEMNPFIAMMAEKPLINLMDEIVLQLKTELEK